MRVGKRRLVLALLLVGAVAVVGGVGGWWLTGSPGDLSLLAPYAERYNVAVLEEELAGSEGARDRFSFVVFGDTRNNTFIASKVYARAATEHAAMAFHTGDLIRGGSVEEYLEHHIPLLEQIAPTPVFCVPGNHERGDRRDFAAYEALYGTVRFSFDYGACRFVGFNASEKIRVTGSELAFLEEELGKPGADHKYVFFHIPPAYFEREIGLEDSRGFEWNADELHDILVRHGVDEVFMGHIHGYATAVIDGVRYTLTAGGGAPFSRRLDEVARITHYVILKVSPEGVTQDLVYIDQDTLEWTRRTIY